MPRHSLASDQIVILLSADIPSYLEAQEGIKLKLGSRKQLTYNLRNNLDTYQTVMNEVELVAPKAVIAIGPLAVEALRLHPVEAPVVFCMVVNHAKALKNLPTSYGIAFQLSPEESFDKVHQILPHSKIAVLYNPEVTEAWLRNLMEQFEGSGMKLIPISISGPGEISGALMKQRKEFTAIWILPDGSFVNDVSLDYFIRYSMKEKVPLIGFSEGLARSGALVSVGGNYKKMGEKSVEMLDLVLAKKQKERVEYLKDIKTYLNAKVAELFNISINPTFYAHADGVFPSK